MLIQRGSRVLIRKPGLYEGLYLYTIEQRIEILRRESMPGCVVWFLTWMGVQNVALYLVNGRDHLSFTIGVLAVVVPALIFLVFRTYLVRLAFKRIRAHVAEIIRNEPLLNQIADVRRRWEDYLVDYKTSGRLPRFDSRHYWLRRQYQSFCREQGTPAYPPVWPVILVLVITAAALYVLPLLDTTLGVLPGLADTIEDNNGLCAALYLLWMMLMISIIDVMTMTYRLRYLAVLQVYSGLLAEDETDQEPGDNNESPGPWRFA